MDDDKTTNPNKTVVTAISQHIPKAGPNEACLVAIYGDDLGRRVALAPGSHTIGRSSKCEIQLDQESVSRSHARIEAGGGLYTIRDLGSTNGTYVNDELADEIQLRDGDQIKIGRTIFKFISSGNVEAQYHEEIYRLMTVDGLTEVHNKRFFAEALEREASRCRRYDRTFSLVMFDIDHFKQINDTYGHLAGDAVLRQLGALVRTKVRRDDVVARTGGEEFGVILPEVQLDGAIALAEKLRELVAEASFRFEGTRIPVTISLGVCEWGPACKEPDDLVRASDDKLYQAKRSGRNRVCG